MYIPSSERESQKKGGMFEHQNDLAVLKTHFVCLQNLWGYCKPSTIRKGFQFTWQKLSFDIAICSHEQNTFTSILTILSQGRCVSQSWCLHQNKEGIMRVEGIDNQKPYLDLLESFISSAETQACTFTFWANCHHLLQDHCRMLLPARSVLGNCLLALVLVLYHCRFINLMDLQISLGTLSPSAANSLSKQLFSALPTRTNSSTSPKKNLMTLLSGTVFLQPNAYLIIIIMTISHSRIFSKRRV